MQRNLNSGTEFRHHAFAVERNNLHLAIREVFRQEAADWAESVIGVRNREFDLLDANFEGVSRFGLLDIDWPDSKYGRPDPYL